MEVFWVKGFDEASMTDLTGAMGIASPSLYAAFGSKEALFHEAVALYQDTVGAEIWSALDAEPTVRGAISSFLFETARAFSNPEGPMGCLNVLGAKPAPVGTSTISDDLRHRRAQSRERLRRRFERAVAESELHLEFDCEAAAAFYATLQNGMSILAREGADANLIRAVATNGVLALDAIR